MDVGDVVGTAAATCSVCAFVPQAYKIFKTRETKDLSLPMWVLQVIGFALWVAYGFLRTSYPIIVPNIVTFALSCWILGMKIFS